jgi:hypothetical protein
MKRIGKTDDGGILMEMTAEDLNRFQQAMEAVADLLVAGANHGIQISPEFIEPKTVPVKKAEKQAKKYVKELKGAEKACVQCGEMFDPPRKDSRLCSKACTDKFYRAKKTAKPTGGSDTCSACGKPYIRKRKDQSCCSAACRRKTPRSKPEVVKPDVKAPARTVINDDVKKTRMETLRKLVKKDAYVPPVPRQSVGSGLEDISEFRQAQREARRE